MASKNYYRILGVTQKADEKEIRRRFRELARQYHPDVSGKASSDRFHEINEAYQVLSDTKKRARYDLELNADTRTSTGKAAYAYSQTRPPRPAPKPGHPYASHRRPAEPEPMRGPVHNTTIGSSEAIAGVTLFVGMIVCAVLSYAGLQVLNVLAGDQRVITMEELPPSDMETVQADMRAHMTAEAMPTLVAEASFDLQPLRTTDAAFTDDPLFAVLHGDLPPNTPTCSLDLSEDGRACAETDRIAAITGDVRDGRVSVRVKLDQQSDDDTALRRAVFVINFRGSITGTALNIGDSRQNNGDGRRAISSDPVHSAEVVVDDGDFFVYGYRNGCIDRQSTLIYGENDYIESGTRLIIEVSDQQVRWINDLDGQALVSRCLFQLGGQTVNRGDADWDIYAGLNRAIRTGTSQRGSGVSSVDIYLLP